MTRDQLNALMKECIEDADEMDHVGSIRSDGPIAIALFNARVALWIKENRHVE